MQKELVSICIPTYNRENYLKRAIYSAINQTYSNIEIIITDNGNGSPALSSLLKKYRFIRYFKNSTNIGSVANLKKAASYAKGEYIKFLLDDDVLKPKCIEKMIEAMRISPKIGLVMAPLEIIDENGNKIEPIFYGVKRMKYLYKYLKGDKLVNGKDALNDFLTRIYPCCVPTGIMIRTDLYNKLGGFKERFSYIADLELCMNFATRSNFYYIDEMLSSWQYSTSSETVSILHKKGIDPSLFYKLTKAYGKSCDVNLKKAFLFASKRTAINIFAGLKTLNMSLIVDTIKTIYNNDPYLSNKLALPFELLFEVVKAEK